MPYVVSLRRGGGGGRAPIDPCHMSKMAVVLIHGETFKSSVFSGADEPILMKLGM